MGECEKRGAKVRNLSQKLDIGNDNWSWGINKNRQQIHLEVYNGSSSWIGAIKLTTLPSETSYIVDRSLSPGERSVIKFDVTGETIKSDR